MAAKEIKLSKGEELYDAGRRHVLAEKIQPLPENLKKKISIILEAVPARSKSEIAEVLQACDYQVDKALNYFIAGGMEVQNEWVVQGKRKNKKKKKPGKKATKNSTENQPQESSQTNLKSDPGPTCSAQGSKESEKEKEACQAVLSPIPNGVLPQQQHEDKKITIEKDATTDQVKPLVNGELKAVEATLFETISPPLLSPTESLKSSPDSPSSSKGKPPHHSPLEKHPRVRTQSTSGPEVIRKSLKDLQRSSVSIARFQSMFDAEGESSTKMLAKNFQVMRQALDEREKLLEEQLQSVIEETKKLLDERQQDAAGLKFKCNRVGTMTEDETTELRNQIKHFVGERRIDEDLGKTIRFVRDEEKMMEAIKSFGEVTPIKHQYTTYKRKQPDPVKEKSHPLKPPPVKTTHLPSGASPTADTKKNDKPESANETRGSNSRSNKQQPVLSPSRLKDQAEMHARLQEALKQQVGSIPKDSKQGERPGNEKQKPKEFGGRSRFYSAKQQNESRRQHTPQQQQHRQEQTKNSTPQNSSKSPNKNGVGSSSNEKAKTQEEKPTGSNPTEDATTREEKKENPRGGNKEKPGSGHVNPQPGSRRTKRQYIKRNTPLGSGDFSNNFTNSNVHEKKLKDENSLKEPGSKQGSNQGSTTEHLSKEPGNKGSLSEGSSRGPGNKGSTSESLLKEPGNKGSTSESLLKKPGNKGSLSEGSSKEPGKKGCSSEGSSKQPGNMGSSSEGPSKGPGNKESTSESLLKKTGNKGSLSDGSSKEPGNKGSSSEGSSKEPGNKESTNESLSKEPGNKGSTESKEGQNIIVNGTNGFAPLPQRNPRGRKIYYKRDPETEVKFPPPKENGSVGNNSASRQSTVA